MVPIENCAMTTVIAPMGYGKTTAVNWYLEELSKTEDVNIVRISVYSDSLLIFWESFRNAFIHAGYDFIEGYPCPDDTVSAGLFRDAMCRNLAGNKALYIFIDDFHLMNDPGAIALICSITGRLPKNVHMIIAGRDTFLPQPEVLRLGMNAYEIGVSELSLNRIELSDYSRSCGVTLSDKEIDEILYSSEGWFSAVYLMLCNLYKNGCLPDSNSDIYSMFISAMLDPLTSEQTDFLAVMSLADEFTAEMAGYITGHKEAGEIIDILSKQNAFISRLPGETRYRFHHMMKECSGRIFKSWEKSRRDNFLNLYGSWFEEQGMYLKSLKAYMHSSNYDAMLKVIIKDAGIVLSSLKPEIILRELDNCPEEALKRNPHSILVLMRCMFNWQKIERMLKLKELLMEAVDNNDLISPEERGNLIGECDLITSFLMYNDIGAMSRLHRSASAKMSGAAISIRNTGGWTFGSPSVLMMFHREPGQLQTELASMDECMPHYYRITNGHGRGAEKIMRSEAALMQGRFIDAEIELEKAYRDSSEGRQTNMELCCDFTARRLCLFNDLKELVSMEERYEELIKHTNIALTNILNAIAAYYYALLGENNRIPELFREHRLSEASILAPGAPMYEIIENQVYLTQGVFAKVAAGHDLLAKKCEKMHYAMVAIYNDIQTAAAYEMLGKHTEAVDMLEKALAAAEPDGFILPFAENYAYIGQLLHTRPDGHDFLLRIEDAAGRLNARKEQESTKHGRPDALRILSEREYDIILMKEARLSNREIAEKLYLSEGSIKQYINRIYSRLNITGDSRSKRQRLFDMLRGLK